MILEHWFWLVVTAACVVWYSTITIFVAVRGVKDIRGMLQRLAARQTEPEDGNGGG